MIRIARTFTAKPGKEQELLEILKDFRAFASTQNVAIRIFTEPWGPGGRLRLHTDFEDAGAAQTFWQDLFRHSRAQELRVRLETLIEGHYEASFLVRTT